MHADDPRLRRMAVFDVIVNNADRKGGHILAGVDGGVYGVDHGVSLHVQDKLRTVLWGWAGEPIDEETLSRRGVSDNRLGGKLGSDCAATSPPPNWRPCAGGSVQCSTDPVMPKPDGRRPLPWPAF